MCHGQLEMGGEQGLVQASGLPRRNGVLEKDGRAFMSLGERGQKQILLIFSDDIPIFFLLPFI